MSFVHHLDVCRSHYIKIKILSLFYRGSEALAIGTEKRLLIKHSVGDQYPGSWQTCYTSLFWH